MKADEKGGDTVEKNDAQPIDLAQLSRQTQRDIELEREVLELFAGQARSVRDEITSADAHTRAGLAHSLVGSSRAVGAFALADAAAALEIAPESEPALERFRLRIEEVCQYISGRLR